MSAGKTQGDAQGAQGVDPLFTEGDPWMVQNAKGRVRPAESEPTKPTLSMFMPPGFASITPKDAEKNVGDVVAEMKTELATLERLFEKASKSSPRRASDGMPTSALCRSLWEQIGELNSKLGQLRGSRPKFPPGARRWQQQRVKILEERGCKCCPDADESETSDDGAEVGSNVASHPSENRFF